MKIIVSTESEKKLVKRFIDELRDSCVLENINEEGTEIIIDDNEIEFVSNGLYEAVVEVGKTNSLYHDDDIIRGVCVICGTETHGTLDGDDVDYDEYLEYNTEEVRKTWKCSDCIDK